LHNNHHHCRRKFSFTDAIFLQGQLRFRRKLAPFEADIACTTRSYSYTNNKTAINSIDHHIVPIFDAHVPNYPKQQRRNTTMIELQFRWQNQCQRVLQPCYHQPETSIMMLYHQ
jgi:hypothetical protein